MKLCFLDTETTGLENGRIVQLAYELYDSKSKKPSIPFERKYKPPIAIGIEAMATHHITEKMVENCLPFTPGEIGDILTSHVMVAHNAPFDIGILENEGVKRPKHYIDTKKVAQNLFPEIEAYNLQFLRYKFGLEVDAVAHDALGDIRVLKEVFMHLFTEAMIEQLDDLESQRTKEEMELHVIKDFIETSINPIKLRKITFGKHQGMTFDELARKHIDYLRWLKKSKMEGDPEPGDEDLLYTLSFYL